MTETLSMKAWEILKGMITEFKQGTQDFQDPVLHMKVLERAMDVIESAMAVAQVAKDGITPDATMVQLQEAVEAFNDLDKPRMWQEEEVVIVLADDEGKESEWTIAQIIKVDEKDYAILLPLHDEEESEEAVIMRIDQEDGEDVLVEIDNEDEFERVADAWEGLIFG